MDPRYRRAVATVLTVGVLALAGVVGATLLLRAGSSAGDGGDDGGGEADVVPSMTALPPGPGEPQPVPAERLSVEASSFLAPDQGITYEPANTIDDDLATAWNSDAPGSDGRGQTLTYRFTEPVPIASIRFVNGYAKNETVYTANHRIQDLLVHTDRGTQRVTLLDTADLQEIEHDFGYTSRVTFEVVEIYTGAGFDDETLTADLALTEVEFLTPPR